MKKHDFGTILLTLTSTFSYFQLSLIIHYANFAAETDTKTAIITAGNEPPVAKPLATRPPYPSPKAIPPLMWASVASLAFCELQIFTFSNLA